MGDGSLSRAVIGSAFEGGEPHLGYVRPGSWRDEWRILERAQTSWCLAASTWL